MVIEAREVTCPACGTALMIDGDSEGLCPTCLEKLAREAPPPPAESSDQVGRAAEVLDTLIDARLLTSYEVPAGDEPPRRRIEVVHESLLSHWPRLMRWQTQDKDGAQLRDELRAQAQLWQQHDRSEDYLWTGTAFKEYELWRERYSGGLTAIEEEFAEAMTELVGRRRRRRQIALISTLILAAIVIALTSGLWIRSEVQAQRAAAAHLFSLAQLQLDVHPSAAIAYATASLELADNQDVRELVVEALWRGPAEFRIPSSGRWGLDFSPDGEWLVTTGNGPAYLWSSSGGLPRPLESSEGAHEVMVSPRGDSVAQLCGPDRGDLGVWTLPEGAFLRSFHVGGDLSWNYGFDYSEDGTRLVTSTYRGTSPTHMDVQFRSWPVAGGEPELLATTSVGIESDGAFSGFLPKAKLLAWADGQDVLLASSTDNDPSPTDTVRLHHQFTVGVGATDPSGRRLATAATDGRLSIWSLVGGQPRVVRTYVKQKDFSAQSLRFNQAGTRLVGDRRFLWNLDAPAAAEPLHLQRSAGTVDEEAGEGGWGLAFDPMGRWVATGHVSSVSLWPLVRAYPYQFSGHEKATLSVAFTPDGRHLLSTSMDGSVRVWPLSPEIAEGPRTVFQSEGPFTEPWQLAVAADSRAVVIGNNMGQVHWIPLDGGEARQLGRVNDVIRAVAIGTDSKRVAAGAGTSRASEALVYVWDVTDSTVQVLDAEDGARIDLIRFDSPESVIVGSGGKLRKWILDGNAPRVIEQWAITVAEDEMAVLVDLSADGRFVLWGKRGQGTTSQWIEDLQTGSSQEVRNHQRAFGMVLPGPAGRTVVSFDKEGVVRVGSVDSEESHLLLGHEGEINGVAVSADGRWIASTADDALVYLWPMPDLDKPPLHTLPRLELLAKLRTLTNLIAVEAPDSPSGWKLEIGPFPGWEEVPTW